MCAQEPEWNELDKLIDPEQRAEPPFLQVEPQTMDLAQSKWKQIKWVSWPPKVASSGRILLVAHFRSFIGDDHPLSPLDDEDTGKMYKTALYPQYTCF